MFNKKITKEDKIELLKLVDGLYTPVLNGLAKRINGLVEGIDFNGNISGNILEYLLQKSGLAFYQETGDWTDEDLKSLGDYKEFVVNGVRFILANPNKVEGEGFDKVGAKTKKTKRVNKVKKINK